MATSFDRWEKDPFFAAAEEVQESSDRMESVYRRWIQEKAICGNSNGSSDSNFGFADVSRELHTTLGTAKWQLEELERAIESSDDTYSAGDDTRTRHSQFISAIRSRIDIVENSLKETSSGNRETNITWVNLDKEERDELALFLSCPSEAQEKKLNPPSNNVRMDLPKDLSESGSSEARDGRIENKHRRFLSADANIGSWKMNMPSEGEDTSEKSSEDRERPNLQMPKILSFSGLNGALEMKSRGKWYKSGGGKGKGRGRIEDFEALIPLQNKQANEVNEETFCEGSRNCLSTCGEENCEKEINGWVAAFHRQIQRSQYHIQYGRPLQLATSVVIALLFICDCVYVVYKFMIICLLTADCKKVNVLTWNWMILDAVDFLHICPRIENGPWNWKTRYLIKWDKVSSIPEFNPERRLYTCIHRQRTGTVHALELYGQLDSGHNLDH